MCVDHGGRLVTDGSRLHYCGGKANFPEDLGPHNFTNDDIDEYAFYYLCYYDDTIRQHHYRETVALTSNKV